MKEKRRQRPDTECSSCIPYETQIAWVATSESFDAVDFQQGTASGSTRIFTLRTQRANG